MSERRVGWRVPHYKIVDKNKQKLALGAEGIILLHQCVKSIPWFGCTALFPSLEPEGPAGARSTIWEEIARIRRALGILLR